MAESKERLEPISKENVVESGVIKDLSERLTVPKGVETWMEKVEKGNTTQQVINDSATGQPMLTTPVTTNPKIKLPVTRTTFAAGFKKSISEAGRWLSVFLFRLIKIKKGNVEFKKDE